MAKQRLRDEDLILNIIVNGDQGKKEILDLENAIKGINRELNKLEKERDELIKQGKQETAQYKAVTAAIELKTSALDKANGRIAQLRQGLSLATMSVSDLRREITRLTKLRNIAPPGSAEFAQLEAQLKKVQARYQELAGTAQRSGSFFSQVLPGQLGVAIGRVAAFGLAAQIAGQQVRQFIAPFAEFDDAMADVRKTTGLTNDELESMNEEIKSIDTRTSQLELLKLARTAGKLGIDGKENVLGFVRAADQIAVALSEDLGGDVETAIRQVGKLVDIFNVREEFGIEQGLMKVGSVINELGVNSTASEEYMVDFTKRLAGVAPAAKISIANVLAYSSTLDQLGQSAEVAGTTFVNLIPDMFTNPEKFAKVAGIEIEEFNRLLNTDTNEALIRLFQGVRGNEEGMTALAQRLVELGLDGARATNVVGALANNIELIRNEQRIANQAFEEGISLTNEFAVKNETLGAQLEKIGRYFYNIYMNSALRAGMRDFFAGIADWLYNSDQALKSFQKQDIAVKNLEKSVTPLIARYKELQANTNRSAEENEELKEVINQIGSAIPGAISQFDGYGNAIAISTEKAEEFIKAQKLMMEYMNKEALREQRDELIDTKTQILEIMQQLNRKDANGDIVKLVNRQYGFGFVAEDVKLTAQEITNLQTKLAALRKQESDKESIIKGLSGGFLDDDPSKPSSTTTTSSTAGPQKEIETLETLEKKLKALQELRQAIAVTDTAKLKENERQQREIRARIDALQIDFSDKAAKRADKEADKADKDAEREAERLEKQAQQEYEIRRKAIISQLDLVAQEKIAHEERLKEAGLYYLRREDLDELLLALEALEKQHFARLNDITSDRIDENLDIRRQAYENQLSAIRTLHNEEYKSLDTLEKAKNFLRGKVSDDVLRGIRNMRQAQVALDKVFLSEEEKLTKEYLQGLLTDLQTLASTGQLEGIDLANEILSPEQKAELAMRILVIYELLSSLGLKSSTAEEEDRGLRRQEVDILGFTVDDWQIFFANLEKGKVGFNEIMMGVQALQGVYATYAGFVSASERKQLADFERANQRKQDAVRRQLDAGIINQDQYNNQIAKLQADLDKKKAVFDRNEAKRERNVALMTAIVNGAAAVASALKVGPVFAAIVGALAAVQVGTILKTPLPEIPGAESGGYLDVVRSQDGKAYRARRRPDQRGFVSAPTVLVGESGEEFVANADAVSNPTVRPVLDAIDTAQRQGRVNSLDLFQVLEENRRLRAILPGRQRGGRMGTAMDTGLTGMQPSAPAGDAALALIRKNTQVMARLSAQLARPIRSDVSLTGRGSLEEKQEELNVIIQSANL